MILMQYLLNGRDGGNGLWIIFVLISIPFIVGLTMRVRDHKVASHDLERGPTTSADEKPQTYGVGGFIMRFAVGLVGISATVALARSCGISWYIGLLVGTGLALFLGEREGKQFRGSDGGR